MTRGDSSLPPRSPPGRFRLRPTREADIPALQQLCKRVYPFHQPWDAAQLRSHLERFPEGQFVVEDVQAGGVAAMSSSLIIRWDDYDIEDGWRDFTDHGYFTNHDPAEGRTLYGAEVSVDPGLQGHGLGKLLYGGRRALVRRLGLLRIRAGARLRGYHAYADRLTPQAYLAGVVRGEYFDPTISFQLRQGFHVMALVPGYLANDPETKGWAVVIEWLNPEVAAPEDYRREALRYERLFADTAEDPAALYEGICRLHEAKGLRDADIDAVETDAP